MLILISQIFFGTGSASPQAVRKLLALSEPNKTRPHQPRAPTSHINTSQASPAVRRAPSATGMFFNILFK